MDNISGLFSPNGGQGLKSGDGNNHIQGLFYDLLASLAGGDHPRLPAGYKAKPMTGFCEILDAFNETIKIREAGSGLIEVIDSSAEVSAEVTTTPSDEMSNKAVKDSDNGYRQPLNMDSTKSFSSAQELFSRVADGSQNNSSDVKQSDSQLALNRLAKKILPNETLSEEENHPNQAYDNEQSDPENYEDAFDFDGPNPILSMLKTSFLEAVGPPLVLSKSQQSSLVRPLSTGSELNEYSDELKNVEKLLRESTNPAQFQRTEFPRGGMSIGALIGSGILPLSSFPDTLMNPSDALERIYDAESSKSPCHPQSGNHVSPYQSCTSSMSQCLERDSGSRADSLIEPLPASWKPSSPSIYTDCLNLTEAISDADFIAALDAALCEEDGGNSQALCNDNDGYKAMLAKLAGLTDMSGIHLGEDEISGNADKSAPYYSVDEESDSQQEHDAVGDKQKQQKRKTRFQRAQTGLASKEWDYTSASESGSGDKF